ncbi:MAG: hypothetical protein WD646_08450 [Actinomycetota bacterium]
MTQATSAAEVQARTDDESDKRRRLSLWDLTFFVLFAVFVAASLLLLVQGAGAVWASLSPDFLASLRLRGLGTGFAARAAQRMARASHTLPSGLEIGLGYAFSVFNIALAIFLLWLRPRDRTARLLAVGMIGTAGVFNLAAQIAFEAVPLTRFESFNQSLIHIITGLAYGFALVHFPDGRFVPRWRAPFVAILYLPFYTAVAFLALQVEGTARPGALLIYFGLAVPALGVFAQAYRFRRAGTPVDSAQARLVFWALIPALAVGVWFVLTQGLADITQPTLLGRHLPEAPTNIFRIFQPVFLLVPVAIFLGLLRFRLWDIDRVVNRTLVYGLATGILIGLYAGVVVLLQGVLDTFTAGSDVAVALSTLAVATAAFPLRRRIQDFVDRRFYRHRYDAQRTIEAFSTRLRDEVEMEALAYELRGVVTRTMQPTHLTLLLKDPDSGGMERQWTYRGR